MPRLFLYAIEQRRVYSGVYRRIYHRITGDKLLSHYYYRYGFLNMNTTEFKVSKTSRAIGAAPGLVAGNPEALSDLSGLASSEGLLDLRAGEHATALETYSRSASGSNQSNSIEKNTEVLLGLKRVSIYYGDTAAVKQVTFPILRHKITSIIGPSGCGKSTLLRAMNRMNDFVPNVQLNGNILYDGHDYMPKTLMRWQCVDVLGWCFRSLIRFQNRFLKMSPGHQESMPIKDLWPHLWSNLCARRRFGMRLKIAFRRRP